MLCRAKKRLGLGLAELMVTIGVMGIVVSGMYMLFSEGLHFFRASEASTTAEISILKSLASLSSEVSNANSELVRYYPNPAGGPSITHHGIVFASAIDSNGYVQVGETSGKLYWQKYVCYYYEPNPSNKANGKLYRKELDITASQLAGDTCSGSSDIAAIVNGLDAHHTDYFASATTLPTRLLGDSVCGFDIEKYSGAVTMSGGGPIGSYGYSLDLTLEAGDPDDSGPESFYIKIESRVTPKNSALQL